MYILELLNGVVGVLAGLAGIVATYYFLRDRKQRQESLGSQSDKSEDSRK